MDGNSKYWRRKSSYLLNDLRNFNDIFRIDVTYDNIKSRKKPGLHRLSRRYIFGNPLTFEGLSIFSVFDRILIKIMLSVAVKKSWIYFGKTVFFVFVFCLKPQWRLNLARLVKDWWHHQFLVPFSFFWYNISLKLALSYVKQRYMDVLG